jgi:hypothetical protein
MDCCRGGYRQHRNNNYYEQQVSENLLLKTLRVRVSEEFNTKYSRPQGEIVAGRCLRCPEPADGLCEVCAEYVKVKQEVINNLLKSLDAMFNSHRDDTDPEFMQSHPGFMKNLASYDRQLKDLFNMLTTTNVRVGKTAHVINEAIKFITANQV